MKILICLSKQGAWFDEFSKEEQEKYLEQHPHSKLTETAKPKQSITDRLSVGTKVENGKLVTEDGSPLPDHIASLKLPPAWTDVRICPDPEGTLLASGRDSKGRLQCVYSEAFSKTQAEAKFARVQELRTKFTDIHAQNEKNTRSRNPKVKDTAECLKLIMHTGIRPGSEDDTGAAVQAYGASTLLGSHVVETKSGLQLHFTGKKGVNLKIPVTDESVANMLRRRKKAAGAEGQLFPNTHEKHLLNYSNQLDGGGFKTKDFRTHVGTSTALSEIEKMPVPKDEKEYRKQVLAVAKIVSSKLGNTPVVALASYIAPECFAAWQIGDKK